MSYGPPPPPFPPAGPVPWVPPQAYRMTERRGANHILHLFLTIITGGLWAFTGWPIAAAMGRKTKRTVWH